MSKFLVEIEIDAPEAYGVGQTAAAIGLAFSDGEAVRELEPTAIEVRMVEK